MAKTIGAKLVGDARSKTRELADEIRKLGESQAIRTVDRAIGWARLLNQFEGLLDRADDLFTYGVPANANRVKEEHARMSPMART